MTTRTEQLGSMWIEMQTAVHERYAIASQVLTWLDGLAQSTQPDFYEEARKATIVIEALEKEQIFFETQKNLKPQLKANCYDIRFTDNKFPSALKRFVAAVVLTVDEAIITEGINVHDATLALDQLYNYQIGLPLPKKPPLLYSREQTDTMLLKNPQGSVENEFFFGRIQVSDKFKFRHGPNSTIGTFPKRYYLTSQK